MVFFNIVKLYWNTLHYVSILKYTIVIVNVQHAAFTPGMLETIPRILLDKLLGRFWLLSINNDSFWLNSCSFFTHFLHKVKSFDTSGSSCASGDETSTYVSLGALSSSPVVLDFSTPSQSTVCLFSFFPLFRSSSSSSSSITFGALWRFNLLPNGRSAGHGDTCGQIVITMNVIVF